MSEPLIIPVRANGTIAPYPVGVPSGNGMSENDLEGFLAAQGFEVREEPVTRKIGFVAAMNREEELRNEKEEEAKAAELAGDSRHFRTGSGNHGDKRKQKAKKACRDFKWKS